jgi:transmembrane sensor
MMSDKRMWELLAKQFNKEISEEELRELHLLLNESHDGIPNAELLSDLHALTFKPGFDDRSRKENSLSAIQKAIREKQAIREHSAQRPLSETARVSQESGPALPEATGQLLNERRRMYMWLGGIAVSVFCCIAGFFLIKPGPTTAGSAEQFDKIVTRTGSKTLINLPDSSSVILNSACQFGYNKEFGVTRREMQLSGEAYFDIHKNPDMPLVIHAGNVIIRVLGTTFNVRANPEDSFVEATLLKGIIEVSLVTDPERKILLRPNEKIIIRNSDEFLTGKMADNRHKNRDEVITVTKVQEDPVDSSYLETAWIRDKMFFHKESFVSLAAKMERWYNVKIVLTDTALNSMLFTGSLEKESLDEAFRALRNSAAFNYTIVGKTVTISKK